MKEQYKKLEQVEGAWGKLYDSICRNSRSHNWTVADMKSNRDLNRYMNVKPYDQTRVKLVRLKESDYINASFVSVPNANRRYILTQSPLFETVSHFWLMVWEQKSTVIVMLNKIEEDETFNPCMQYWSDQKNKPMQLNDVKLNVTLKDKVDHGDFCIRRFVIRDTSQDKNGATEREVLHFNYTAWPDHGSPSSPVSFLRLLVSVRKSGGLDNIHEPCVVHCLAGIGRSGTFCLIDSVLTIVERQGTLDGTNIESLLLEMREQRPGLIQSTMQLKFSYTTILYGQHILDKSNKQQNSWQSSTSSLIPAANISEMATHTTNHEMAASRKEASSVCITAKEADISSTKSEISNEEVCPSVCEQKTLVNLLDKMDSDTAEELYNDFLSSALKAQKAIGDSMEDTHSVTAQPKANAPADSGFVLQASFSRSVTPDSTILKRRERELREKKLADKILEIKTRMKKEDYMRERSNKQKRLLMSAGVGAFGIISAAACYYLIPQLIPR